MGLIPVRNIREINRMYPGFFCCLDFYIKLIFYYYYLRLILNE